MRQQWVDLSATGESACGTTLSQVFIGLRCTAGIPKGREPACLVVWEPGLAYWVSLRPPDSASFLLNMNRNGVYRTAIKTAPMVPVGTA